uniref:Uncharacterized protein n=1 Tax=Paramoeba aestuarina TaxID=180227 RepID=A0A7S4PIT2_9EUKA|mmetsp:Transcript_6844/g.10358  ORF Transcript_6844/g.10358 Transcript_6844/m.10358 type:complete len:277 (+) Transcript_6844:32-862(+)|eukprot:CAMPEP_0201521228 /NCGR_PEP_ID=MMETSP0161_2-20130828/14293_1 /ASSEMBLY_ACC=CAM_ASM_000251 /TAXON_ID=180227 /ORGANISM="Neoparamoeba aestuarina, Strain SoJaBio B1-5/56/2" /LENGTH=276 /DNA_ID=CAMNT_0047919825 /DNA_START=28 /DNA_END=858 /DNA_ORIENTATION=+
MATRLQVALVTGSNKGIGYEIVKGLLSNLGKGWIVYLTSRNPELGNKALEELKSVGEPELRMHQLDITNKESVASLKQHFETEKLGLDILVNNAGFAYKSKAPEPFSVQARNTIDINYYGTLNLTNALFPFLTKNARVVNVGSMLGAIKQIKSKELADKIMSPDLTEEGLTAIVEDFVSSAQNDTHQSKGFPNSAYSVSKIAVHGLTRIWAKSPALPEGATVNVFCPGWCKTDMAGHELPPRTATQGADTGVYLSTLSGDAAVTGKFFSERKEREW